MALGDNHEALPMNSVAPHVAPISMDCQWIEAIEAGKISTADASDVDGTGDFVDTRVVIKKDAIGGACTTLVACIKYDDGVSAISQAARIGCIGRCRRGSTVDNWVRLRAKSGNAYADITPDPTKDMGDGTFKRTTPNVANAAWDTLGCNEFVFFSELPLTGTGTFTTATLEVKGL